jgi:hypothetical protein
MSSCWGWLVHILEVPARDTSSGESQKLTQVSQKHACYQMSMNTEVIKGIVNVDSSANLFNKHGDQCRDMNMRKLRMVAYWLPKFISNRDYG